MSDLLTKWLAHYDPIHRGWTPAGIANAVCATNGFAAARPQGGCNLYRGTSYAAIDRVVGAAAHDATAIAPFTWVPQQPGTIYYFRCLPIGGGGVNAVENPNDPQVVVITIDPDGEAPAPVPPPPQDLRVAAIAGGAFRVSWLFVPSAHFARVATFAVYTDGGSGDVDYEAPAGTVNARTSLNGAGHYAFNSDPYDHAAYVKWAVRARTADGDEEANTVVVEGQADAQGPADHRIKDVAYGVDE